MTVIGAKIKLNKKASTRQGVRTAGRGDEIRNSCGAFVHQPGDQAMLNRFLTIGSTGGTYYVGEAALTDQWFSFVNRIVKDKPGLALQMAAEISAAGRAYSNDQAIYVLAVAAASDNANIRRWAVDAAPRILRTSTHLMTFAQYYKGINIHFGSAGKKIVRDWYSRHDGASLAYQAVKYRGGREGWTHRDLMRLSHPKDIDEQVARFIFGRAVDDETSYEPIYAFELLQKQDTPKGVIAAIRKYPSISWEMIPTQFLKEPRVWDALIRNGLSGQALIRNLSRMHNIGVFTVPGTADIVATGLVNDELIRKTRLHPMNYLFALVANGVHAEGAYRGGYFGRGKASYCLSSGDLPPKIMGALETGFYRSFKTVPKINKNILVGVDISGSMDAPVSVSSGRRLGAPVPSCRMAAAALAMVIRNAAPRARFIGFDRKAVELDFDEGSNLTEVMREFSGWNGGSTDLSLPFKVAEENPKYHGIISLTDNETNHFSSIKPSAALVRYRNNNPKLGRVTNTVVAMSGNRFSVNDPKDPLGLDVSGFDASMPAMLAAHING